MIVDVWASPRCVTLAHTRRKRVRKATSRGWYVPLPSSTAPTSLNADGVSVGGSVPTRRHDRYVGEVQGTETRSEERRVGKECRSGWAPDECNTNTQTT